MLKQSVRIFLPDPEENSPRIWLSSGTYPASDAKLDRVRYRDNAFLPQAPWREPSSELDITLTFLGYFGIPHDSYHCQTLETFYPNNTHTHRT